MYSTSMEDARIQLVSYSDALKTAKPDTAKRLNEIVDRIDILSGLFQNSFETGSLFMNGYHVMERVNFELKAKIHEQEKKITMLQSQLDRK